MGCQVDPHESPKAATRLSLDEIATLDIAGDQQAAQRALMLNNKSANSGLYGGELAPRQPYSARVLHEQRANRLGSPATYRIQQDVYVEDPVVLAELFRWLTW
jgi:hypothetical protein